MMKLVDLSLQSSAIHNFMEVLRNVDKQGDRQRFRSYIKQVGVFIGYEISKGLNYAETTIQTPLTVHVQKVLSDEVVIITVLRAGLSMHEGLLDVFPEASSGFLSAYRKHHDVGFTIEVGYIACPDLNGKTLIINDPMLATGQSFVNAWSALLKYGIPAKVILAAVIASEEGVAYLEGHAPADFELWVGAIDPLLDEHKYIVPGLGDAGDLSFGAKLQQ